jgi:hypothetical protein
MLKIKIKINTKPLTIYGKILIENNFLFFVNNMLLIVKTNGGSIYAVKVAHTTIGLWPD